MRLHGLSATNVHLTRDLWPGKGALASTHCPLGTFLRTRLYPLLLSKCRCIRSLAVKDDPANQWRQKAEMRSSHDRCHAGILPLTAHCVKPRSRLEKSGGRLEAATFGNYSVVFPFDRTHSRLNFFDNSETLVDRRRQACDFHTKLSKRPSAAGSSPRHCICRSIFSFRARHRA